MFNKAQLKERYQQVIDYLSEPPHTVLLTAGGALVMMGLREQTEDLDLDIPESVYNWCARSHPKVEGLGGITYVRMGDDVSFQKTTEERGLVCIEGVWCYSPREMLYQKQWLATHANRPENKRKQDLIDINQLRSLSTTTKFTARSV
jgi:hypothetical protein